MKTEYQYIHFDAYSYPDRKTGYFMCHNNRDQGWLGEVKWNCGWRQYCFFPAGDTVFSKGCMEDINNFITQLMEARKK